MDFQGKNVWIIGASSGIGRALAMTLARRGARVAISSRRAEALEEIKKAIGPQHIVVPCDVTDAQSLKDAVQKTQERLDVIHSVIFLSATYAPGSVLSVPMTEVRRVFDTNILAPFALAQEIIPVLRFQREGQLAFCASVAGYRGLPNGQPYAASKAALISLAETLRAEEAPHGIDIRVINPGFVDTPMTSKNLFAMPLLQTPEKAARAIADGLSGSHFEIHFPPLFTYGMKLLRLLPDFIYFRLMRRLV
jgi:NAD(P)-dependent dehydrogenase (short-subunit alcohol dehydrogenase family)